MMPKGLSWFGREQSRVMSIRGKWAFEEKVEPRSSSKLCGKLGIFDDVIKAAFEDNVRNLLSMKGKILTF